MFKDKKILDKTKIIIPTLDVFKKHYSDSKYVKKEFENLVKTKKLIPFFAFYDKLFIGKAYLVIKLNDLQVADGERIAYICNLEVNKFWRNKGIGTKILNALKNYAMENGFIKLTLAVDEESERNMHLYNKLGFDVKIKNIHSDLLFKDSQGNDIKTKRLGVYCCKLQNK